MVKVLVAEEAFEVVRVLSEEGGRRGRERRKSLCPPSCSQHPLEYRNVDGFSLGWRCGHFRIERKVDILLNIALYHAKIMTFMTIQHMDFSIRWASVKTFVRFVTSIYDDEKAEFQHGLRPQFLIDDINPFHLYRVFYALEVWSFDLCILTISDVF